ncbi:hypothetical protein [Tenacibaculum agarivorans]|uniref:hypothetical protein n=1 Tax=Tenacibaculum agarivorans TaxID=1908389 RepID=UPI00094B841F|nr:hypothetical protein [Tenacibaculum agarivorans]
MQNNFKLGVNHKEIIKNENVKGILLTFYPRNTTDQSVGLNSFSKTSIKIELRNSKTKRKIQFFSGYLDGLIEALYAQETLYESVFEQLNDRYQVYIPFAASGMITPLHLKDDIELVVDINVDPTTFSTGISKTTSYVEIETTVTTNVNHNRYFPVITEYPIESGKNSATETLGSDIVKAVFIVDNSFIDYSSSSGTKISNLNLTGLKKSDLTTYNKNVSENLLFNQQRLMLAVNPDSTVYNPVIYIGEPLDNVSVDLQFNQASTPLNKIITVKLENY